MKDYPDKNHLSLFRAIRKIRNNKEASAFFRDLMTIKEMDDLSKRWQQAQLLYNSKMSYEQIAKKTDTSTTTVTRVAHWLNRGMGGYKLILKRIKAEN